MSVTDIPIRCGTCGLIRRHPGSSWRYWPKPIPGEVEVICQLCLKLKQKLNERKREREGRELLRRRAKGYGPAVGDVFAGFKGE